ncbi:hypothetical protein OHA72_00895 [Dactylosporangium sp. NBC_01737]|uniref:hypothetical protein n=1 Tax=Dactylosporangium sp. NBC_01737 TaxID=2975959 RepID=UPI002E163A5E|nr:hypothetical protein OHA72_00895 [Dactylosporangium sp. NBC_01737]
MSIAATGRSSRSASSWSLASAVFMASRISARSLNAALSAVPFAPTVSPVASVDAADRPSVSTDCCAARLYAGASTAAVVAVTARRKTTNDRPDRYLMPRSMTVQAVKMCPLCWSS